MADAAQAAPRALGAPDVVARKGSGTPLVMVTAYDAPSARAVDAAGVDMILVGDSVAMVVLGYDDTLHVTIDDMAHHTGAVARTKPRALVVADLPWMSYHRSRRRDGRERRAARARRRDRGEARGRPQAGRRGARDPRRRDPGDGPPRPHAPVGAPLRGLPGAGQDPRRGARDRRRRGRAGRGRVLRDRARVRARRGRPHGHRLGARAHHRHRRRSPLRRPGARVPRHPRLRGPRAPEVRAALRRPAE